MIISEDRVHVGVVTVPQNRVAGMSVLREALCEQLSPRYAMSLPVLICCANCNRSDGPYVWVDSTQTRDQSVTEYIAYVPFEPDYRVLSVSHCRECML